MTDLELKNTLQDIIEKQDESIESVIAYDALNYDESCKTFFEDIQNIETSTGIAIEFIFNSDIDSFFEDHYIQIELLRKEFENKTGKPFPIKGDLKKDLSWFAFEQTALTMAKEFKLEI